MIKVTARIENSKLKEIEKRLRGPGFDSLLQKIAADMVAQVRRNIVTEGKPSGSFAKLSGYNANNKADAKERIRQQKKGLRDDVDVAKEKRRIASSSRHTGYARQKEADHEAGRIPFGPGERLRRTGNLVENLTARVTKTAGGARIAIGAEGRASSGITNEELLSFLSFGTETMPARNPTINMVQFETRMRADLQKLIGGVANGK